MGKIPNWTAKHGLNSGGYFWENDSKSKSVEVKKGGKSRKVSNKYPWAIYIAKTKGNRLISKKTITVASNKEKARKKAVKWMRKHPNP